MLNDRVYYIFSRLLSRLFGLCLIAGSFIIALSLFSFDSSDPSFNTVSTDDVINNWMGSLGAHISDLFFQLIGLSGFFVCLIIFSIGTKMASRSGIRNLLPKIILIPFSILCISVFFATLPQPSWWEFDSLGGVNGHFILTKISNFPKALTSIISLFFSIILISTIIEISLGDWIYSFRYFIVTLRFLIERLVKALKE